MPNETNNCLVYVKKEIWVFLIRFDHTMVGSETETADFFQMAYLRKAEFNVKVVDKQGAKW